MVISFDLLACWFILLQRREQACYQVRAQIRHCVIKFRPLKGYPILIKIVPKLDIILWKKNSPKHGKPFVRLSLTFISKDSVLMLALIFGFFSQPISQCVKWSNISWKKFKYCIFLSVDRLVSVILRNIRHGVIIYNLAPDSKFCILVIKHFCNIHYITLAKCYQKSILLLKCYWGNQVAMFENLSLLRPVSRSAM